MLALVDLLLLGDDTK